MSPSYDVSIWNIASRKNTHGKITSYKVRWRVDTAEFIQSFTKRAQADSYRSNLVSAQNKGEPFSTVSGLPRSMERTSQDLSWYDFTCRYVDMKWPDQAATSREGTAEALLRTAPVFMPKNKDAPDAKRVRSVLRKWAYNTDLRDSDRVPAEDRRVLDWLARNMLPVKAVEKPETIRALERAVTRTVAGKPYAPPVARKNRSVLSNALQYAVELDTLQVNPLPEVKWTTMPKGKKKVDKRAVPNPIQARSLLAAVRKVQRSGPRLEAFFAVMYFGALRPEEAAALNKRNLSLPPPTTDRDTGEPKYEWGELHLDEAWPHAAARWHPGGDGKPRDKRGLKARAAGEGRTVPCPPELTEYLLTHIEKYPPGEDGTVFTSEQGKEIPEITYTRVWRAARGKALTTAAQATPLARRPYDLRHAAVSTWLAGQVDPARVAEWAGHSISVLFETYAAFLDGGDAAAKKRVQAALGHGT